MERLHAWTSKRRHVEGREVGGTPPVAVKSVRKGLIPKELSSVRCVGESVR
jgi:hypothetical protein